METNHAQTQIEYLQTRMRFIRESQHLTLLQAARLSNGEISAIALGSYERGDRSVSTRKLIQIANLYNVPVSELFERTKTQLVQRSVSIDLRKLISTTDPNGRKLMGYIRNIVRMRGDWNGEIISLRSQDLINLEIFSEIAPEIIQEMLITYGFPRTK